MNVYERPAHDVLIDRIFPKGMRTPAPEVEAADDENARFNRKGPLPIRILFAIKHFLVYAALAIFMRDRRKSIACFGVLITCRTHRRVARTFLKKRVGEKTASVMIDNLAAHGQKNHSERWMLKYMAFGSITLQHRKRSNQFYTRIISIGDGADERKAIGAYAAEYKTECIHFEFLRYPTTRQLCMQWDYIASACSKLLDVKREQGHFHEYAMLAVFKADNNRNFSGKERQLDAIVEYFEQWTS